MSIKLIKIFKVSSYLIIIGIIIIVTLEFALRTLGYTCSTPHIMYDKYCYWRMSPNQQMRFKDPYGRFITSTINSYGSRNKELPLQKPLGERRIICIGDSFTYGLDVDDTQTYPSHLQNLIDKNSLGIKIFNFGCNGHTILHETNFIKKYGQQLQPDYVIVAMNIQTDFSDIDELGYNLGYMPMPGYNFIKYCIRKTAIGNILLKFWNAEKVKGIIAYRNRLNKTSLKDKEPDGVKNKLVGNFAALFSDKRESPFGLYLNKLDELIALGREKGFKIIYIIMPFYIKSLDEVIISGKYRDGVDFTARQYYDFLKNRYLDEVIIIELMSNFNSEDLFLPDGHLNAKGNRLVAEIIYEEFFRK